MSKGPEFHPEWISKQSVTGQWVTLLRKGSRAYYDGPDLPEEQRARLLDNPAYVRVQRCELEAVYYVFLKHRHPCRGSASPSPPSFPEFVDLLIDLKHQDLADQGLTTDIGLQSLLAIRRDYQAAPAAFVARLG